MRLAQSSVVKARDRARLRFADKPNPHDRSFRRSRQSVTRIIYGKSGSRERLRDESRSSARFRASIYPAVCRSGSDYWQEMGTERSAKYKSLRGRFEIAYAVGCCRLMCLRRTELRYFLRLPRQNECERRGRGEF